MKKIFLFIVLLSGFMYFNSCKDEGFTLTPQTYVYIQHTAFSINTAIWTPGNHRIKYTVTMQNIGTETAKIIRTQLYYKKPSAGEQNTNYLLWLNSDSSKVEIPPGASVTHEITDTVSYVDSVSYWRLSYNTNTVLNTP